MSDVKVQIILPLRSNDDVSAGLRYLTEVLCVNAVGEDHDGSGGLGGSYGYGVDFENDTFAMRRFWWGDCECGWDEVEFGGSHDQDCYQTELRDRMKAAGVTWGDYSMPYDQKAAIEDRIYDEMIAKYGLTRTGCAVHCTCTYRTRFQQWFDAHKLGPDGHAEVCRTVAPNFEHKPTGSTIRWYKWIGRDNEADLNERWDTILDDCLHSLKEGGA